MRMSLLVALALLTIPVLAQDTPPPPASIIVVSVSGEATYDRPDLQNPLPIQIGQFLAPDDTVTLADDASVQVICPDGNVSQFFMTDLTATNVLPCGIEASIVGDPGLTYVRNQKGGKQDASIPYLIAPRATLVRTPSVMLVWNAPLNVEYFTLTVRSGIKTVWESEDLLPADVVNGPTAHIMLPVTLEEDTPYTIEICVLFSTLQQGCTTDAGWSTGAETAFYYIPDSTLDDVLQAFDEDFGVSTAESRYAQAVVLYQPLTALPTDNQPRGYYSEAISVLESLLRDTPDHALAQSPATYNLLGELYRLTNLPLSSARAYQHAVTLAQPATEPASRALMGSGLTTPSGNEVEFYSEALDTYAAYLTHAAFLSQFEQTCRLIGDICLDLPQCNSISDADCRTWYQKS